MTAETWQPVPTEHIAWAGAEDADGIVYEWVVGVRCVCGQEVIVESFEVNVCDACGRHYRTRAQWQAEVREP